MSIPPRSRTGYVPGDARARTRLAEEVRDLLPPLPCSGRGQPDRWPQRSYLELGALPGAVPCSRLHAKQVLWEWRFSELTEIVELVVAELVTNAVQASSGLGHRGAAPGLPVVRLWLAADEAEVLVQVWDASNQKPQLSAPDVEAESGRGLLLVAALSAAWGSFTVAQWPGKVVWAVCGA